MVAKATLKLAGALLDRFFRDAEGKTNRQLDVYFTVEDLQVSRDKSDPAIEFLVSRGLINQFGPDIAFLTDRGVQAVVHDADLASLPQDMRDFAAPAPVPPEPSGPATTASSGPDSNRGHGGVRGNGVVGTKSARMSAATTGTRPEQATLTHIDLTGKEFSVELGWSCTIGRSDGNTIQISDKRASKNHAEIRYESGQFVLRDLESANGTLVNGDYVVQPVVLEHDDEVVIGRTMLLYTAPLNLPPPMQPPMLDPAHLEPATLPEPSSDTPIPPIKVVQGTPSSGPGTLSPRGTGDLGPTSSPPISTAPGSDRYPGLPALDDAADATPDLFAQPARGVPNLFDSRRSDTSDLFDDPARAAGADAALYGEGPPSDSFEAGLVAAPPAENELFEPAPFGPGGPSADLLVDSVLLDSHPGRTADDYAGRQYEEPPLTVTSLAEGLQEDLQPAPPVVEVEPFASLDDEPDAEWVHDTHASAAPLLENQPVVSAQNLPHPGADGATLAQPQTDDIATLMVSREALFGPDAQRTPVDAVHPAFGAHANGPQTDGPPRPSSGEALTRLRAAAEGLPIADMTVLGHPSTVSAPSTAPAPSRFGLGRGPTGEAFVATLDQLKQRVENASIPDRATLLDAINVLRQHPALDAVLSDLDSTE